MVNSNSTINFIYIAGFFDGEGCVYTKNASVPVIEIAQSEPQQAVLFLMQSFLALHHIPSFLYCRKTKRQPCWRLRIHDKESVVRFLRAIRANCVVKRIALERALRCIKTTKWGRTCKVSYARKTAGRNLYNAGQTLKQAAKHSGMSRQVLHRHLTELGELRTRQEAWIVRKAVN